MRAAQRGEGGDPKIEAWRRGLTVPPDHVDPGRMDQPSAIWVKHGYRYTPDEGIHGRWIMVTASESLLTPGTHHYEILYGAPDFRIERITVPGLIDWENPELQQRVYRAYLAAQVTSRKRNPRGDGTPIRPNPDLPAPDQPQLPALPVGSLPRYQSTPPPVDFALATQGKFDLIYKPEGTADRKTSLEERFQALLSPVGFTSPQRWEDVLAGASRRERVFLIDRSGERWEVVDLAIDHGGETGQLRLRHLGSRSRGGDMVVDLRQLLGHAVPVMVYKNPSSSDERQRRAEREGRLEDAYRERIRRGEAHEARQWLQHVLMAEDVDGWSAYWSAASVRTLSPTLFQHSIPREWLPDVWSQSTALLDSIADERPDWFWDQLRYAADEDILRYADEAAAALGEGRENPGPDERRRRAARESAAGVPGAQARLEAELRRQPLRQPRPITFGELVALAEKRGWQQDVIAGALSDWLGCMDGDLHVSVVEPQDSEGRWQLRGFIEEVEEVIGSVWPHGLRGKMSLPGPSDTHQASFLIDPNTMIAAKEARRFFWWLQEQARVGAADAPARPEEWLNRHFSRCGLNADWCVQAWHLGPSPEPNRTDGDYYVIDNEDDGSFSLVRRYYSEENNDDVQEITSGTARHCVATWRQLTDPAYQAWGAELRKRSRRR